MNGETASNRRATDSKEFQLKTLAEKILTLAAIIGAIATVAIFYTRVVDLVDAAPVIEKRLKEIETRDAIQEERWQRIEKFMERLDRRSSRGG